jgi:hypothetical protein
VGKTAEDTMPYIWGDHVILSIFHILFPMIASVNRAMSKVKSEKKAGL